MESSGFLNRVWYVAHCDELCNIQSPRLREVRPKCVEVLDFDLSRAVVLGHELAQIDG